VTQFLEHTLDKFTFKIATGRFYNADGVWASEEDGRVRVGLSDFMQQRNGDIAFIEVVEADTELEFGEEIADVETIKVDISLPSPVTGAVIEVNPALEMEPEVINQDPYGQGWIALVEAGDWPADREKLLDAQAYYDHMLAELEEETRS